MIILDKISATPLYIQLYQQIRDKIISGEIESGHMLPSIRILSHTLSISQNTVKSAYLQLYSEGYVQSKAGSGYKVQKIDMKICDHTNNPNHDYNNFIYSKALNEYTEVESCLYNFQYGKLDFENFPFNIWRKMLNQALLSQEGSRLTDYNERKGDLDLRIQIMKYLHESRGVQCNQEQIIICPGSMSCLSLICQLFLSETNIVAVEDPCYDTAKDIFRNHNFRIVPIPLESDGIQICSLSGILDSAQDTVHSSPKLLYTTPSHQFPSGVVMPINNRLKLLSWAEKNNTYIIEDDYDSEFRYNSRPIPSIHSLDQSGRVIYINSFSKALAPGLRLGFIVLPAKLVNKYNMNFSKYHCAVPWLEQRALYYYMQQGYWKRFLNKSCLIYKRKFEILISCIHEYMKVNVIIHGQNAGLHVVLEIRNGKTEQELIQAARNQSILVYPISNYWLNKQRYSNNMVLIGFSSLSEEDIKNGIQLLSVAWFGES